MNARSRLASRFALALALGACSSSNDKGGGAGSDGGTAGADAGADTSGSAGNDGGAGADAVAEAAPSPELNACGDPAKLGAATVLMQTATEGGDRSTMTLHDSVAWLGQLNDATRPATLDVQLYKNAAPFGAALSSMSIALTGQSDFATCGACVLFHPMYNDGVEVRAQPNYIATGGTLNVTAVPGGAATKLVGTLTNVTFEHVMIDPSFKTTKLDDCTITLASATISSDVKLVSGP